MLATLVIGLREGLEAALVVGIIAAFLKRNGRPLTAMWIGVALAVVVSVAVGVALFVLEAALPQAAQEGLETVIGAVAVVFVTGMLLWMARHARSMKRELEASATAALHGGTAVALAGMAFLAVLKEGFETSVFLLATFRAAQDEGLAALGALLGIAVAVGIGVGIYTGGVRIDLGRFFRYTSAFLVVVAAGLVLTAVRTAHEAGWIDAGQQRTVDLSWLAPGGSVQGALITGMLGIPADPRLLEVVAWFAYLVPTALIVYWPAAHRPSAAAARRLRWIVAGGLVAGAAVLAVAVPSPNASGSTLPLAGTAGSARLDGDTLLVSTDTAQERLALGSGSAATHDGATVTAWTVRGTAELDGPATLTLDRLMALSGGRVPVGIDPAVDRGPFTARWQAATATTVWGAGGALVDAQRTARTTVTVSGGGLAASRSLAVIGAGAPAAATWRVIPTAARDAAAGVTIAASAVPEHRLWALQLPAALLIAAALVALSALRRRTGPIAPARTGPDPRNAQYAVVK